MSASLASATAPMTSSPNNLNNLAAEILLLILESLPNYASNEFYSLCLTSKRLGVLATPYLYKHLTLVETAHFGTRHENFLRTAAARPDLTRKITSLHTVLQDGQKTSLSSTQDCIELLRPILPRDSPQMHDYVVRLLRSGIYGAGATLTLCALASTLEHLAIYCHDLHNVPAEHTTQCDDNDDLYPKSPISRLMQPTGGLGSPFSCAPTFQKLTVVHITNSGNVEDGYRMDSSSLIFLLELPHLVELRIRGFGQLERPTIAHTFTGKLSDVEYLSCVDCEFDATCIDTLLRRCHALTFLELELGWNPPFIDRMVLMQALERHAGSLDTLLLTFWTDDSDNYMPEGSLRAFTTLKHLEAATDLFCEPWKDNLPSYMELSNFLLRVLPPNLECIILTVFNDLEAIPLYCRAFAAMPPGAIPLSMSLSFMIENAEAFNGTELDEKLISGMRFPGLKIHRVCYLTEPACEVVLDIDPPCDVQEVGDWMADIIETEGLAAVWDM